MIWLTMLGCKVKARLCALKTRPICVVNDRRTTVRPETLRMNFKLTTESKKARQQNIANQRVNYCDPWEVTSSVWTITKFTTIRYLIEHYVHSIPYKHLFEINICNSKSILRCYLRSTNDCEFWCSSTFCFIIYVCHFVFSYLYLYTLTWSMLQSVNLITLS